MVHQMNNYQLVLQIPYVKFAIWDGGYTVLKNKYRCQCHKCGATLTVGTYMLWKKEVGCMCASDCMTLKEQSKPIDNVIDET